MGVCIGSDQEVVLFVVFFLFFFFSLLWVHFSVSLIFLSNVTWMFCFFENNPNEGPKCIRISWLSVLAGVKGRISQQLFSVCLQSRRDPRYLYVAYTFIATETRSVWLFLYSWSIHCWANLKTELSVCLHWNLVCVRVTNLLQVVLMDENGSSDSMWIEVNLRVQRQTPKCDQERVTLLFKSKFCSFGLLALCQLYSTCCGRPHGSDVQSVVCVL